MAHAWAMRGWISCIYPIGYINGGVAKGQVPDEPCERPPPRLVFPEIHLASSYHKSQSSCHEGGS